MKCDGFHEIITKNVDEKQPLISEIDIVVCGGEGAGKSSCLERFLFDEFFPTRQEDEEERTYRQYVGLTSGGKIKLNILDTMIGNTVFGTQRYNWIQFADAFYLVYDLTDSRSFRNIHYYVSLIERVRGTLDKVPIILCGSKLDLVSTWRLQQPKKEIRPALISSISSIIKTVDTSFLADFILTYIGEPDGKEVRTETGVKLAHEISPYAQYFECSALLGTNILESWSECINMVLQENVDSDRSCIVC